MVENFDHIWAQLHARPDFSKFVGTLKQFNTNATAPAGQCRRQTPNTPTRNQYFFNHATVIKVNRPYCLDLKHPNITSYDRRLATYALKTLLKSMNPTAP